MLAPAQAGDFGARFLAGCSSGVPPRRRSAQGRGFDADFLAGRSSSATCLRRRKVAALDCCPLQPSSLLFSMSWYCPLRQNSGVLHIAEAPLCFQCWAAAAWRRRKVGVLALHIGGTYKR